MPPDQNQYPIDYLNQIAAKPQKTPMLNNKLVYVLIGAVVLLIIVAVLAISNSGGGPKQKMETLAARLQTLQTITDKAQHNIKSGQLRSINSNITIYLTNTNRDIADPLKKNGVDVKKLDKTIVKKENGDDLTKKLEDARLNAVYDRTYASEMTYQLETVAALLKEIYNSTSSKSLKDFLLKTDNDLQPLKKQLADYSAASS